MTFNTANIQYLRQVCHHSAAINSHSFTRLSFSLTKSIETKQNKREAACHVTAILKASILQALLWWKIDYYSVRTLETAINLENSFQKMSSYQWLEFVFVKPRLLIWLR